MEIYYTVVFFIFGLLFGSFYNVVGYRLPIGKSVVKPRSNCTNCHHELGFSELIPIFSYLFQGMKCKNCKIKISWIYSVFEFSTGLLFALSFLKFGFSIQLLISLIIISTFIIITISDIYHMIIPDEILIISLVLLSLITFYDQGVMELLKCLLNGFVAFGVMFGIKLLGDYIFKKESMGGGDIKLLFLSGFILGIPSSLLSIFVGSVIALPISLIILYKKNDNVIPFGPFLSLGALILYLTNFNFTFLLKILTI